MNGLKLTKKLVIDTDGVVDDVRAISLALQTPDVEVYKFINITKYSIRIQYSIY